MSPVTCSEVGAGWLLESDSLSPEQRRRFEQHLEACASCQERLIEPLRRSSAEVRRLAGPTGDPTRAPADAALSRFLRRALEGQVPREVTGTEPADLSFLQSAVRAGLLGTLGPYEVHAVIG